MTVLLRWRDIMNTNSNASVNSNGIKNSWSLVAFAKSHGRMQVGQFSDPKTGDSWKSCIFTSPVDNTRTFVAFSRNLGPMSPADIAAQKDDLQVVQCTTHEGNDMFALCKRGAESWEDVNLGL